MPSPCKSCGKVITNHGGAMYCSKCAGARGRARVDQLGRKRPDNLFPLKVDGEWVCVDCKVVLPTDKLMGRSVRPSLRCANCHTVRRHFLDVLSGKAEAARAVGKAKRDGTLRPVSEFACVDCARPAECYDHRDYSKPLDVVPVCRS